MSSDVFGMCQRLFERPCKLAQCLLMFLECVSDFSNAPASWRNVFCCFGNGLVIFQTSLKIGIVFDAKQSANRIFQKMMAIKKRHPDGDVSRVVIYVSKNNRNAVVCKA